MACLGGLSKYLLIVPLGQQFLLSGFCFGKMHVLDVSVAADVLRDRCDFGSVGVQPVEKTNDHVLVLPDQRPLLSAFGAVTEDVQRTTTQESQPRQQSERSEYPGAVFALVQVPLRIFLASNGGARWK